MKVYIVTSGAYSAYTIEKVFASETLAEEEAKCYEYGSVVDQEVLTAPTIEHTHPPGLEMFQVVMEKSGDVTYVSTHCGCREQAGTPYSWSYSDPPKWVFYMWAKDSAHAVKIANERRSALLASGMWSLKPGKPPGWESWKEHLAELEGSKEILALHQPL